MAHLTPDMARNDPHAFKAGAIEYLCEATELGGALWNVCVEAGVVDYQQFNLDADTWVSGSRATGYLKLGTAPMDPSTRGDLVFKDENLTYTEEITRRLAHELGHGALWLAQGRPNMHTLHQGAFDSRMRDEGRGLSAIGSLPYYQTCNDKAGEDVAELVGMRTVSRELLEQYATFLAAPNYAAIRQEHGLTTIGSAEMLTQSVDAAVYDVLAC